MCFILFIFSVFEGRFFHIARVRKNPRSGKLFQIRKCVTKFFNVLKWREIHELAIANEHTINLPRAQKEIKTEKQKPYKISTKQKTKTQTVLQPLISEDFQREVNFQQKSWLFKQFFVLNERNTSKKWTFCSKFEINIRWTFLKLLQLIKLKCYFQLRTQPSKKGNRSFKTLKQAEK